MEKKLIEVLHRLTCAVEAYTQEVRCDREELKAIRGVETRLQNMESKIMTAIETLRDYAVKQQAYNDRQALALDSVVESQAGLTGDIKGLNDTIKELQNSVGPVSPEDQALIDDLQAKGDALSNRAEDTARALKALDEATPPVVPAPGP